MPNYSLIVNSKFRPFEFSEMLQPVMIAEQAHKELEDAYSELYSKSSVWDKMTNSERDKVAHGIYSSYAQDLEQQAEELSKYGLNPSSRQQMLKMKGRYSRDIVPIEQAYKRREEQIAEQRKAGNSMIYDYDAQTTSLDKFIENPALSYKSIDRRDLYTRAMNDFSQYAKALADYGNGKRLDSFTKTFVQSYGITPEQARDFVTAMRDGNINATNPTLRAVYNALYDSTGVSGWNNAEAQQVVSNTILEGVGAAIGKSAVSPYEDKGAVMAQQLANQKKMLQYQMGEQEKQRMRMYDINPTTYYSASEIAAENNKIAKKLDKWREKGYFDAQGNLTEAGIKARQVKRVSYEVPHEDGTKVTKYRVVSGDPEFEAWSRNVMKSPYAGASHGNSVPSKLISNYYNNVRGMIGRGELATGTANFNVYRQRLTGNDSNTAADNILAALGEDGNIIRATGLDSNGNIIGENVSKKDFISSVGRNVDRTGNSNILYIMNSPTTGKAGQQLVELTNGEKYILPPGILGTNTQSDLGRANLAVRNAGSNAEVAVNLNRGNSYLASMLTTTGGTEIKPNDGTITIDLPFQ